MKSETYDVPEFGKWEHATLAKWAEGAYLMLQRKHEENEQLKLAAERLQRELGHFRNNDDWR